MMKKWYALKVFYNRFSEIKATLSRDGIESYIPMKTRSYPQPDGEVVIRRVPLVAMLMFLRCDDDYISSLNSILDEKAMVAADVNVDGTIDTSDALAILQFAVKLRDKLPTVDIPDHPV